MTFNPRVHVEKHDNFSYPEAPFAPATKFPELGHLPYTPTTDTNNNIYGQVRDTLMGLELDKTHQNTPNWKPFKDLIKPGQHAVLKPNFVKGTHPLGKIGIESMITHASLMRPIIDYILISTKGDVKITICDVPLQTSVWEDIMKYSKTEELVEFYKQQGISIELLDLRREISILNDQHVIQERIFKDRDPKGYAAVNIGDESAFMPIIDRHKRFMITNYDKGTVSEHHNPDKNEYCVAKTILDADLFINMPKLKTHRKAGLTVSLKNLIGINGDKRWIAHHTERSKKHGGDEYPELKLKNWLQFHIFAFLKRHGKIGTWAATKVRAAHTAMMKSKRTQQEHTLSDKEQKQFDDFKKRFPGTSYHTYKELNPNPGKYMEGSWYGNDTIWRTIADLNYAILYADREGVIQKTPQRNYFALVDGILGGEKEAPMEQIPVNSGVIMAGFHPLSTDHVAAYIMGLDESKIPSLYKLREHEKINADNWTPDQILEQATGNNNPGDINMKFAPPVNWAGHVERN